jgi:hypothetical protein
MSADEIMLSDRLKACDWIQSFRQSDATTRGGNPQVVEHGRPFWVINFRYENLIPTDSYDPNRLLSAWLGRRNGQAVPFTAYRPSRRTPFNHPTANNSGLVLSGYNSTTGAITLNKGNMAEGDMVSWDAADGSMFVGEIVTIDAVSGSSTTFKTFPFAKQPAGTENAKIVGAVGRFRLIPASIRPDDRADKRHGLSFSARQIEKEV